MAYTSGDVLVRAVMLGSTGLPKDSVTNDFAFHWPSAVTAVEAAYLTTAVDRFYNFLQASGHKVGEYISNAINRSATHRIDCYHIVAGALGSPFLSTPWLGPPISSSGTGMPTEACAVVSFKADMTGAVERGAADANIPSDEAAVDQGAPVVHSGFDKPRARRRGRLYIGPMNQNAVQAGTPPYLLDSTFLQTLRQGIIQLVADSRESIAIPTVKTFGVWSRRDQTVRVVTDGWTDNAPDTQRRRGQASNARVVYTV